MVTRVFAWIVDTYISGLAAVPSGAIQTPHRSEQTVLAHRTSFWSRPGDAVNNVNITVLNRPLRLPSTLHPPTQKSVTADARGLTSK